VTRFLVRFIDKNRSRESASIAQLVEQSLRKRKVSNSDCDQSLRTVRKLW
jgi:hypothetical protein